MSVFISYSSVDGDAVSALARHLQASGKNVWFDKEIHGGEAWWAAILKQIRKSSVFIFALSPNSLESDPCALELAYARALGLPVLPVEIGDISPEERRNHAVYNEQIVDYRNPTAESAIQLMRAVKEREATRKPLPDPLPPEPPIPYEYLARLGPVIRGSAPIEYAEQQSLFTQLRDALRRERNESVRASTRRLLLALRDRPDATRTVMSDIDALLADEDAAAAARAAAEAARVAATGAAVAGAAAAGVASPVAADQGAALVGSSSAGEDPQQPRPQTPAESVGVEATSVPPPPSGMPTPVPVPPPSSGMPTPPVPPPPYGGPAYAAVPPGSMAGQVPPAAAGGYPPNGQFSPAGAGGFPPNGQPPKSRRNLAIILGSVAAAVILIVVVAVVVWPKGSPEAGPTSTPTSTPTATSTSAAEDCWDGSTAATAAECPVFTGSEALYHAFSPADGPDGATAFCTEEDPADDESTAGAVAVYDCTWEDIPGTLVQLVEWDDTPAEVQAAWVDRVSWDKEFTWTSDDEEIGLTWERATTLEDSGAAVWWWAAAYHDIPMSLDIFASSSQNGSADTVQQAWDRIYPLRVDELETLVALAQ